MIRTTTDFELQPVESIKRVLHVVHFCHYDVLYQGVSSSAASAASMHMCTLDLQKRTVHHNRKNRVYLVNLLIVNDKFDCD